MKRGFSNQLNPASRPSIARVAATPCPYGDGRVAALRVPIDAGSGVLRLEPSWVPRTFMLPGRRLKLHPDDLYALGGHRGGINERWFSSTTVAANEGADWDEGLSYIVQDGKKAITYPRTSSRYLSGDMVAQRRKAGRADAAHLVELGDSLLCVSNG